MTSYLGAGGLQGLSAFPDAIPPPAVLGWQPILIEPIFSRGQDWIVTLIPACTTDASIWPSGTTITVYVYPSTTDMSRPLSTWTQQFAWAATITGNNVYFKGPFADTDTVGDGALMRIVVVLPNGDGTDTYVWAQGIVRRLD